MLLRRLKKKDVLPGIVIGKHSASYLPAEIPETGEPESAENIIRTQELPVSLLQSPRKKKSRRKSVLKSQAETRVRHRINNSQKMRTGTWGKYGFRWGAAYSIKGSLYITACRSSDFRGVIYPTKFAVRQAMNVLPVILRKNAPWICVQSELIH